jgi:hypothetical protein
VNSAAIIMGVQVPLLEPDVHSFGISLRMVMLDHMVGLFLVFEETPYCFPQWLYYLTFTPAVYKGSFFPHPHKHLLSFVFLMVAILTGVRWNLNVVLICISFMTRDGEHS